MRRRRALVVVVALLVGGVAACGGDDDGGGGGEAGGDTPTTAPGDTAGVVEPGASGSPEVDAYCAAVEEYVPIAQAAAADPSNVEKSNQATEAANGLADELAAVPEVQTLPPEAAQALEQCQIRSAEAGLPPG